MSRTRGYFTAAGVALVLGLAACSGSDAEPEPAPPPTSSSPSPADSPAAPTMPPAARGTDADSAEAFVRFYWETVNHAQRTGDVAPLRSLSSTQCLACQAGLEYLASVFRDGGKISGGTSRVSDARTVFVEEEGELHAVVEFKLTSTRQRVDLPGDERDERFAGGTSSVRARLGPSGDGWVMDYWDKT